MAVYIEGQVIAVGDRAVLLRIKAVGSRSSQLENQPEEWLPFTQIDDGGTGPSDYKRDDNVEMEIATWLAQERGLV